VDATGVILAAKGPTFCAGHDFADLAGKDLASARRLFETVHADDGHHAGHSPAGRCSGSRARHRRGLPDGGHGDLAVASEAASFCTPGGGGGLFCTTPMVAVGRAIGRKRALEMALSGDPIDARTAESWGLIN